MLSHTIGTSSFSSASQTKNFFNTYGYFGGSLRLSITYLYNRTNYRTFIKQFINLLAYAASHNPITQTGY
jgi:hypothetical protein